MFAPKLWAIDLGRSAVKAVLVTPVRDGIEILNADIVPLKGEAGGATKAPSRDIRLWDALAELERRHQVHKHRVAIAIPPHNTLASDIRIALVGKRKIDELVRFEANNAIPFVLDEVLWGYHLFDTQDDETQREGVIFAAKKTSVHTYLHALSRVGVERVVEVTLSPLAALSFVRFEMDSDGSAMLLDVGAEHTNMIAVDGSRFWVRSLQTGGNRVTSLLQQRFNISFDQAEEAKHNIPRSEYAKELLEAIKPGLHEWVAELKTNLDYFQRTGKQTQFDRVYAVGGGSNLIGLKAQIRQSMASELHDIKSLEHIFVSPDADVRMVQSNLDRFTVAIGTGIKALGKGATNVSFLPASAARLASASRAKRCVFAAGLVVWAILLTLHFFLGEHQRHLSRAADQYKAVETQYHKNRLSLQAAQQHGMVDAELAYLRSLGQGRHQAPAILNEVIRRFGQANRNRDCQFVLESFQCRGSSFSLAEEPEDTAERTGAPPAVPPGELEVAVGGVVHVSPGVDADNAYALLRRWLVDPMRRSPLLARATGTAGFADSNREVAGEGSRWMALVQPGDDVVAHKDGEWYRVEEVLSDTRLLLKRNFAGGNLKSDYTISRISVPEWSHAKFRFMIVAMVPLERP